MKTITIPQQVFLEMASMIVFKGEFKMTALGEQLMYDYLSAIAKRQGAIPVASVAKAVKPKLTLVKS